MSNLTTRIGKIRFMFQKFKTCTRSDKHISSATRLKGNYLQIGVGIAAMTSITAFVAIRAENNQDSEKTEYVLCDLDEIVKHRALYLYKAHRRFTIPSFFLKHEPDIDLDWNDVVFCTTNTIWTPINGKDVVRDSSKTFLNNESDIDQQHKLSAERHSSSVCINTLIKGFSISSKVGLTLNAPKTPDFNSTENVEISTAFSRESRKEHTKEEKKGWTVEDNIVVPKKSTITVSRESSENEQDYFFTTKVGVKGNVQVTCYNRKKEITGKFDIPMETIISEEFPPNMVDYAEEKSTEENSFIYISIKGRCTFKKRNDAIVITPISVEKTGKQ